MNIFTANQVNQVYVLKADSTIGTDVTKNDKLGSVALKKDEESRAIYFKHLGAGGLTRSDLIELRSIMYLKATPASKMERKLKKVKLTLNEEAIENGKPIVGQDYVLRIKFDHVIGISPENQYWKYGTVHTTSSTTISDFYKILALSVAKNMSREVVKMVAIYLNDTIEVTPETKPSDLTGTYNSITLKEVEQDWILGIKQQRPISFSIEPTTIQKSANGVKDEIFWGDTLDTDGNKVTGGSYPEKTVETPTLTTDTVPNGKLMADYEYFYMGERADQYRMVGWPNYVPTTYLVDPSLEYDTIGIHFFYTGSNHAVQKSEKDVTFLIPRAAGDTKGELGAKAKQLLGLIINEYPYSKSKFDADHDSYTTDAELEECIANYSTTEQMNNSISNSVNDVRNTLENKITQEVSNVNDSINTTKNSLESKITQEIATINSKLDNYYTKSEVDDKLQ